MNDTLKGVSILVVTALGIGGMLQYQQSWEMPLFTELAKYQHEQEAAELQQSILAGADPTQLQLPSAAGESAPACYQGYLTAKGRREAYYGVDYQGQRYIQLQDSRQILRLSQSGDRAQAPAALPQGIKSALAAGYKSGTCLSKDLIISLPDS